MEPTELEIQVEGLLSYWFREILPVIKINVRIDRRYSSCLIVEEVKEGKTYNVMYNPEYLKQWPDEMVVCGVFHEIGHVKYGWRGKGENSIRDVEDEVIAERFAVKMIKKHYPERLGEIVRYTKAKMNDPEWIEDAKIHYLAYKHVKEYE